MNIDSDAPSGSIDFKKSGYRNLDIIILTLPQKFAFFLTYAHYHKVKRGTTPKTAPSYIEEKEKEKQGGTKLARYKCSVCGYIYDPEKGDPESDTPPGTAFEDLPDDWTCPVCGAAKSEFEKMG